MPGAEYIEHAGFVAEVIRTRRRKTASIKINDGAVSVMVPQGLSQESIQQLIANKKKWIREKLYLQSQSRPVNSKEFVSGEAFSYLGRNYRLKVVSDSYQPAKLHHGQLVVMIPEAMQTPNSIRNVVVRWYRLHALDRLIEKTDRYAAIVGKAPSKVDIKTYRSRWGSCHADGRVLYNWKIIMAPNRIVDYVVVHELCHLVHHNHSPQFWKAVERVMPDYAECREWLKVNGAGLEI